MKTSKLFYIVVYSIVCIPIISFENKVPDNYYSISDEFSKTIQGQKEKSISDYSFVDDKILRVY